MVVVFRETLPPTWGSQTFGVQVWVLADNPSVAVMSNESRERSGGAELGTKHPNHGPPKMPMTDPYGSMGRRVYLSMVNIPFVPWIRHGLWVWMAHSVVFFFVG